jgi:hypothetical protein
MGEALDNGGRDYRRIGSVAPRSLERRVAGTEVLAVDDEDVPLHDVLRPGTGGRQGRAQVAQDLLGLCAMSPMPTMFRSASTASWPPI